MCTGSRSPDMGALRALLCQRSFPAFTCRRHGNLIVCTCPFFSARRFIVLDPDHCSVASLASRRSRFFSITGSFPVRFCTKACRLLSGCCPHSAFPTALVVELNATDERWQGRGVSLCGTRAIVPPAQ